MSARKGLRKRDRLLKAGELKAQGLHEPVEKQPRTAKVRPNRQMKRILKALGKRGPDL